MRYIVVAKTKDDNLTPAQRVHRIDRAIDDIKKKPSLMTKFKRFMTEPIVWPKYNELL